jgi:hypothetical protein
MQRSISQSDIEAQKIEINRIYQLKCMTALSHDKIFLMILSHVKYFISDQWIDG